MGKDLNVPDGARFISADVNLVMLGGIDTRTTFQMLYIGTTLVNN